MTDQARGPDGRFLSGDCSRDCLRACAYPGRFAECAAGALEAGALELEKNSRASRSRHVSPPGRSSSSASAC